MRTVQQLLLFAFYLFVTPGLSPIHANEGDYVPFRENDPAGYVSGVSVIDGGFTATETDLVIIGPDPLILSRFYSSRDGMRATNFGGWRIFPQCLLVLGQHSDGKQCAFTGERSGAILTYNGNGKDPLKIDMSKDGIGMVNTSAGEINGQLNHQNNRLNCKESSCELTLGDGTKRTYRQVQEMPDDTFGGKIPSILMGGLSNHKYFELVSEKLPSGNTLLFTYEKGRPSLIEMKDSSQKKLHASIRFDYAYSGDKCVITATTSDERTLEYHFEQIKLPTHSYFALQKVSGSHCIPTSYEYESINGAYVLKKKILPEDRYFSIEYDEKGRVKTLKEPPTAADEPEIIQRFTYGDRFTEVFNAKGLKTRYLYDGRQQLNAIEQYDIENELYRVDRKYWGESEQDYGMLKALTVADGKGRVYSQRVLEYDAQGNVKKDMLYGNLTGQKEIFLNLDEKGKLLNDSQVEQHVKTHKYSTDGFNLLTAIEDCKGNQIQFEYKTGTNLLIKKLVKSNNEHIFKRTFYFYNGDAACKNIIEDDGSSADSKIVDKVTERHITVIFPKEDAPGVGLPEEVEEKALDIQTGKAVVVRKQVHSYFPQGQIRSTQVYDDKNHPAYTTSKTYTILGQIESETDPEGRQTFYKYDGVGNQVLVTIPHQKRIIERKYDLRNHCYQNTESAEGLQAIESYEFDCLGRTLSSTDRFGQVTRFDYDEFGRLERMIHPTVLDEHGKPIQPAFSYTYDIFGNILSTTDPKGYVTSKIYNIRGSPTQIFYPDGTTELFKYDLEGSLHRSLMRDNLVTVHEYDYLGRISYQETSKIPNEGSLIFLKGHSYKYNSFRVLKETETEGIDEFQRVTLFRHDPAGRIISTIQYDGNLSEDAPSSRKSEFVYDNLGREVKKKIWFDTGPDKYSWECCEYDLLGQIKEKRAEDAAGRILLQRYFDYDTSGRCNEEYMFLNGQRQTLFKIKYDPLGEPLSYSNSPENETLVIINYGGNTLQKTLIEALGNRTEITYDALGRIVSTIKKDAQGSLLFSQNILYDASGNKALETNSNIWMGQTEGTQKTRWIYGPMERLEAQIDAEGTAEEKRTEFSYDQFGRLSTKTLPGASAPLTYTYDKRGFIEQIECKAKEKDWRILNQYSCDASGNIISAISLNKIAVERDYDVFGQMIREEIECEGNDDIHFSSMNYRYDRRGRLKKISLPDKSTISYVYDGIFGQRVDRLSPQGLPLYQHKYNSYDDQGRLFEETGIVGHRTVKHDNHGHKIGQQTEYFSEEVPENGYDLLGNLLEVKRHGDFLLQNGTYTYDSLSQLASEQAEDCKIYSCDSLSNFRLVNEDELISNNFNQLSHFAKREYFYDPQGNLLRKIIDKTETRYTSDILSQLVAVEKDNGTSLRCNYDAFGRRSTKELFYIKDKKKIPLSFSQAFYFGNHELGTLDENEKIQELRIPGLSPEGISQASVAIEIGPQIYAPLHDISGNVIALINPTTKAVVESYSYSAFAEEKIYDSNGNRIFRSAVGNPWRYKEKRMDEETGLIYFGLRYYDPDARRWTSPDPLGSVDGPNLYAFLHNNPITSFDRFGLTAENSSNEPLHKYFYGEVEDHCYCERHRTCKRGGDIGSTVFSNLPKIGYDLVFERIWGEINPWQSQSMIFDLQRKENSDFGIGFINGIWNGQEDSRESAEYISQLAGGYNVHYVHNASHGLADLGECYLGLHYIATEPVRQLHKMWDRFFDKSSPNAQFLMIGHSQGVIHMRNGLLSYSPSRRSRILAIGIAPGAYVYEETVNRVRHYRTKSRWRDIIPWIDRAGSDRNQQSIIDLPSHSYIPFWDHSFKNEIYKIYLEREIYNYLSK